jgi:hypothetical protein
MAPPGKDPAPRNPRQSARPTQAPQSLRQGGATAGPKNAPKGANGRPGRSTAERHESGQGRRNGNVANPMIGSRVQQTCKVHGGANRRSREERQGRNESGRWHLRAEGDGRVRRRAAPLGVRAEQGQRQRAALRSHPAARGHQPGVDTTRSCRWRGDLWTTPREESQAGQDRARARREAHLDTEEQGTGTARVGTHLRRRGEGHECRATGRPDPKACRDGKPLAVGRHRPDGSAVKEGTQRRPTICNPSGH